MSSASQDLFDWHPEQKQIFITTHEHKAGLPMDAARPKPILTVLNYSGGVQSAALLWMVIRGDIPRPKKFVVLNADPGMENKDTYKYNEMMKEGCKKAGIELHLNVPGPNLLEDILDLPSHTEQFRFDNPPYWTRPRKAGAKRGQLMQECTKYYKILPMNRMLRIILERDFGISRKTSHLGENIVEQWIGFHHDELLRVSAPRRKFAYFRYPLIEMKIGKDDVNQYYVRNSLPPPPRSVCNACFANGLDTLKDMHDNRPDDWAQAVKVDETMRHGLKWAMVEEEVFVSETCIPLTELAKMGFKVGGSGRDQDRWSCDSGYCFV